MNRFYLDLEYTNGNYYLGDIFEIAILCELSGYIFHSYIKIEQTLPWFVRKLCNITKKEVEMLSLPFNRVMDDFIKFIDQESTISKDHPIIISHGGLLMDFPLLIVNCMKNKYDYMKLSKYVFVDSMEIMRDKGYKKPGLDSFSTTQKERHSAVYDVKLLRHVVTQLDIFSRNQLTVTLDDILQFLQTKLPLTIQQLQDLAKQYHHRYNLEKELYKYTIKKTALHEQQVYKISCYYFNSSFIRKDLQ